MMNDQIAKLYDQALVLEGNDNYVAGELDPVKFAELIVKECAEFLENNSGYDDANNAWHPEPEDLLKHFGVQQ
jgi:hypothetical protein